MTRLHLLLLGVVATLVACEPTSGDNANSTSNANDPLDAQVEEILATLSLEDKCGEMTQLTLDMLLVGEPYAAVEPHHLDTAAMRHALVDLRVGSILNCGGHTYPRETWHGFIREIQRMAAEEKTSGIPVLYGIDAIHGVNYTDSATLFPQQIALAATWEPDFAVEMGQITAYETRASGIPWNFSPVLDIGRDARWPRLWETFGEDVYLATEMGSALVQGYQGEDPSSPEQVAACMKHFVGYSTPITGKDRTSAWIPERQLREYFLPTFERAIDDGALTLMVNSGDVNGIPVHINKWILTDLLRDELGFDGLVVTDWEDIKYLFSRHRVAANYKDAIVMAIDAGIDMSMVPVDIEFPVLLKELVEEGRITEARLDESVRRILKVKLQLGLWDWDVPTLADYPNYASEASAEASYQAASECITLLKNEGDVLPFAAGARLFVTGPTANSLNDLNGGWSHTWQGADPQWNTPDKPTIVEGLEEAGFDVTHAPVSHDASPEDLLYAMARSVRSDAIVLCLGESPYTETVGDIEDTQLPAMQTELVRMAERTGKPIVVVLVEGRPRIATEAVESSDATVMAYLPGDEGARAIADVLAGTVNPSGKLPFTYPRYPSAHNTYDHRTTDLIDPQFGMSAFNPLFEFGHGLSYTDFAYSNLQLASDTVSMDGDLEISVDVRNSGARAGKEVIQVYVTDSVASIAPSVKRLRAFDKVNIPTGETHTATFRVPVRDLAFVGESNTWITEPGVFGVTVGPLKARVVVTGETQTWER